MAVGGLASVSAAPPKVAVYFGLETGNTELELQTLDALSGRGYIVVGRDTVTAARAFVANDKAVLDDATLQLMRHQLGASRLLVIETKSLTDGRIAFSGTSADDRGVTRKLLLTDAGKLVQVTVEWVEQLPVIAAAPKASQSSQTPPPPLAVRPSVAVNDEVEVQSTATGAPAPQLPPTSEETTEAQGKKTKKTVIAFSFLGDFGGDLGIGLYSRSGYLLHESGVFVSLDFLMTMKFPEEGTSILNYFIPLSIGYRKESERHVFEVSVGAGGQFFRGRVANTSFTYNSGIYYLAAAHYWKLGETLSVQSGLHFTGNDAGGTSLLYSVGFGIHK